MFLPKICPKNQTCLLQLSRNEFVNLVHIFAVVVFYSVWVSFYCYLLSTVGGNCSFQLHFRYCYCNPELAKEWIDIILPDSSVRLKRFACVCLLLFCCLLIQFWMLFAKCWKLDFILEMSTFYSYRYIIHI